MTTALLSLPPGWWQARRYHLIAPLVALVFVALFEQTWLAELLEDQTVNLRFKARKQFDPSADPQLVFVAIDELSLAQFGKWPWPRNVEADFLNEIALAQVNPRTVTFDVMFTDDSNKLNKYTGSSVDTEDAALGDATSLLPSVISGALSLPEPEVDLQEKDPAKLEQEKVARQEEVKRTQDEMADLGPTAPITNIRGDIRKIFGSAVANFPVKTVRTQSLFGFVNDNPSVDDMRHTLPLLVRAGDKVFPSLGLQTLMQMLSVDADKVSVDLPARTLTLKNSSGKTWTIPITEEGAFFINYRRQESFHVVSFEVLLQNLVNHVKYGVPIPKDYDIEKKTLVIGGTATAVVDTGPSPVSGRSPLPYTHLNVINNVLKGDYLSFVPWYWVVVGWLVITWSTLLRLKVAPLVESVAMPILAMVAYIAIAFGIFGLWSIQIALAWPVLSYGAVNFGGGVLRWQEEQKGRQQIKQVFSQMLSPEVMGHLLDDPGNIKMGGSKRPVTILFSDIRDYTKFSEGLDDEELVRQINIYFERMVNCIKECRGTLHKFIGDAIMSVWGDIDVTTSGVEKDAQNAVRSALLMRHRLRELNEERHVLNLTPIRIGIGLNHGVVLVGLIGALSRSEFTVMGDAVNTASRLEGITKEFKTDLAISESVKLLIGEEFLVRRLGFIQLKGKTQATLVYEVLAEKSNLDGVKMSPGGVANYEKAFDLFLARRFAEAETAFVGCLKDYPDDFCTKNYLEASREFSKNPPPPEWDGRIVMTTK
jgi:adenylate cyclase